LHSITITINQRVVSGHAGMTILELARESGINIPTLCDDPNLEPVGACRLCLVENEETGTLMASCVTTVASDMVINTDSPKVRQYRKNIIKLMLASHPEACLICDKGNRCKLRQIASDLGVGVNEMEKIPRFASVEELNPFLTRDNSKCILCGKCIRACQEIVVEGAIDYYQRGFITKPATFNDYPLENSECTFCGTCVAMCPTGALTEKEKPYQGTGRETVQTTCSFCGCGCPILLEIKDNHIVRALPAEGKIPHKGALCVRGSYGYDYINSKDRLTKPLVKSKDGFEEVSWEEGLTAAAAGLKEVKEKHGPSALAVLGSSKCTNEENYLLQRFARTVLETNHIDNGSSLYNAATRAGLSETIGFLSATNLLEALEQAEIILMVGADPAVTAPQVAYALKRAVRQHHAKLILIDSCSTKLSSFAHQSIYPHPESELALLNSLSKVIIDEGLLNSEYLSRQTESFADFEAALENFSPENIAEITGVNAMEIRNAAHLYAGAEKSVIVFGARAAGTVNGAENIKAIANLALLTNNVWGRGCGIYPLQKENNAQGAGEMGSLPNYLPGFRSLAEVTARQSYESLWQKNLPSVSGLSAVEILSQGHDGALKGLYIVGENPAAGFPQSKLVADTLEGLEFLVVQDMFLTETAKDADVVLPAASFAEKEGSFTNFEGRIGWLQQAFPPKGESLADWDIILRLARQWGEPLPYFSLQEVINEIEENVPFYEGYIYPEKRLGEKCSYLEERRNRIFQSFTGFPCFSIPQYTPPLLERDKKYPFYLTVEKVLPHFGSGVRSDKARRLKSFYPEPYLSISPGDAHELSLVSGEHVYVKSPFAQIELVLEVSNGIPSGTLSVPVSISGVMDLFGAATVSEMDNNRWDFSLAGCYVNLERVSINE